MENHHLPMVFLWFSHGPNRCPWPAPFGSQVRSSTPRGSRCPQKATSCDRSSGPWAAGIGVDSGGKGWWGWGCPTKIMGKPMGKWENPWENVEEHGKIHGKMYRKMGKSMGKCRGTWENPWEHVQENGKMHRKMYRNMGKCIGKCIGKWENLWEHV